MISRWAILAVMLWLWFGMSSPAAEIASLQTEWLTRTWETEDGLPENSATAMVQTADGYIWFGTFDGLVRFDGVSFKVFTPDNTPGLPSAGIVNLHLDARERLWVSTYQGLVVREGTEWRPVWKKDGDFIRTFVERNNGDLLLTTFNGSVFEIHNGQFHTLPEPPGEHGFGYLGHVDESGRWWVVQHKFVGAWNGTNWSETLPAPKVPTAQVGCGRARDGGLWMLVGQELLKYRNGNQISRVAIPEMMGSFWKLFEDHTGTVWICTENGLYQVGEGVQTQHWSLTSGLRADSVRFVFEDRQNNMWVGMSGGGLTRLQSRRFRTYSRENGLIESVVHSVCAARGGGAWIASYGKGLFRVQGAEVKRVPIPGEIPTSYLESVLEDRSGKLWFGPLNRGLCRLERDEVEHYKGELTGGDNISALFQDSRGRLWMAGGTGVAVYDGTNFHKLGKRENCPRGAVRCFAEDSEGAIWISNTDAIFRFGKEGFEEVQDSGKSISGITCLKRGTGDTMWLGSLRRGLLRWRQGQRLAVLDRKTGFPLNAVFGIEQDKRGFLWMSSNTGIARAEERELQAAADAFTSERVSPLNCQMFEVIHGLPTGQSVSGHQPTITCDDQGEIWMATVKGVVAVDAEHFNPNVSLPRTRIQEVAFSGNAGSERNVRQGRVTLVEPFPKAMQFSPGSRSFEFRYNALDFVTPEKVRYQTRLTRANKTGEWEDTENRRVAVYPELKPGRYIFSVRAQTSDGAVDRNEASLAFTVLPFFWETSWFRTSGAGVLVLAGWFMAKVRSRTTQTIQQTKRRMALAADVAHLGMWQWDMEKDQVWMTPTGLDLFQLPAGSVITQEMFLARIHSQDLVKVNDALEHGKRFGAYHVTCRLRRPDESVRWITASGLVDFNRRQKPVGMIGVCMDISERRNAEEAARHLSGRLIHAQEDERRRIARELHDDLNQRLAVLSVEVALLRQDSETAEKREQRLDDVAAQIKELASEVHKLSYRLHPAKLDQLGLVSASRSFCRELDQQAGIKVDFAQENVPRNIPEDIALCFYRVLQEALQNIVRHSRSPEAKAHLGFRNEELTLVISDLGKGFDLELARRKGGLGLISMGERVRLVNGTIKIESQVGSGTRITVNAPLSLNPTRPYLRQENSKS